MVTLQGRYKAARIATVNIDRITNAEVEGEAAKLSNPLWGVCRLVSVWRISLKIFFLSAIKTDFQHLVSFEKHNAGLNNINLQALKVGAAHSPSLFLLEVNTRRICLVTLSIVITKQTKRWFFSFSPTSFMFYGTFKSLSEITSPLLCESFDVLEWIFSLWYSILYYIHYTIRGGFRKKYGIIWEFFTT